MLAAGSLERALTALGQVLEARGLTYELVAIGGSSLLLLGLIQRPTRDLDVIAIGEGGHLVKASPLPDDLRDAVRDTGEVLGIGPDWLNAGAADLMDFGLPPGFEDRTVVQRYGPLTLRIASRPDQVAFKLYAAVDQGPSSKHFQDLKEIEPGEAELIDGARWAITHDPSPGFRQELLGALKDLGVEDAEPRL